jgi:hypothetical protein
MQPVPPPVTAARRTPPPEAKPASLTLLLRERDRTGLRLARVANVCPLRTPRTQVAAEWTRGGGGRGGSISVGGTAPWAGRWRRRALP